jgi:uncharacterized protein (TIRG00374 family)
MPGIKLRSLGFWLRLFLAAGLLAWVVERNGQARIAEALLAANPVWVAVAAFGFFLSILAGAYQWHVLLQLQGIAYGFRACFRSYYSGMFLNNFMPGTVGGDALRVWDVHRRESASGGLGKAAAATLLDRLFGFSALAFFSLLALAYELQRRELPPGLLRHLLLAVSAVSLCFAFLLLLLLSRRFSGGVHAAVRAWGFARLDAAYAKVQDSLLAYKSRRRRMAAVFAIACLVQLLRISVHALSAWALHLSIAPSFFFTFIPLIALAAVLPLNVGGWGLPQSLGAALYALPGILAPAASGAFDAHAAAAALAFLPSVIGMFVMLGGGFYFVVGRSEARKADSPA